MVAVFAAMIAIRHSRAEEETGRLELLGATVVGRRAPLTAALAVAALASVAVGAASAVGLILSELPVAGSFAFGASWAGVGVAFAAVGAVAAQVASTARNATGLAIGYLGLAYVLRALGDAGSGVRWLTWMSPIGWGHHVAAFAGNRWSVLLLLAAFAAVVAVSAYALGPRRDLGAGLLADRAGPATAGPRLQGVVGLAWRLERGALFAWTSAFALGGLAIGSIAGDVESIVGSKSSQDFIRRLGGEKGLSDAYLAAVLGVFGLIIAAYGVHAALRIRSEETAQRAEPVLATGVGRLRWAVGYLLVAIAGTTCLALTAGLSAGAARAIQTGHVGDLLSVIAGSLVQLPAVWVVVGVVVAAFGVDARFAVTGWIALTAFVILGEVGAMFALPRGVIDLSPFAHVPQLPGATVHTAPIIVLLGIAAVLTAAGLAGFRHRDIG
jgi:ABC-2 type transport system permease protein